MSMQYIGNQNRARRWQMLNNGGEEAAFSPIDIAGLTIWIDASLGTYIEIGGGTTPSGNGDLVGTWRDQSGNNNHLTTFDNSLRPILNTNVINGLPSVNADGSDVLLKAFILNQPNTIYAVARIETWASGDYIFGGGNTTAVRCYMTTSSPRISLYAGGAGAACENSDMVIGTFAIIRAVYNGASSGLRVNTGIEQTGNPGITNNGGLSIFGNNGGGGLADASIAELIGYNSVISGADDTNVMNYLNNKYNIY